MYESYWQLDQKPFENTADPRFYWPGESHQAALLKLRYAIENRRGAAMLAGVSGSGKTLVVGMLRKILGEDFSPFVHLVFPQMSSAELLFWLADELDGTDTDNADTIPSVGRVPRAAEWAGVEKSIRRIEHFLADNTDKGRHAVVIVDEAHLIDDPQTLEALRLLLNFEWGYEPGLTLLLVGQTGLLPTLQRTPQLEERLGVKCLIRPFGQQETADYVSHRLKVAGATREIFEPDAMTTLHELTHGVARRINRLCDLTLLIGFAEEHDTITASQIEAVCQELVAVAPE